MASPQKENGYTAVANEILEAMARTPFNATQLKIILVVWRYTYGFNRKQHEISESFIVKATGISKRYVSSELNKLIDLKVINLIKPSTYTKPKTISFNKNYEEWLNCGTNSVQMNNSSTVEEKQDTTVEQSFNTTVEELFHQERKKENLKKIYSPDSIEMELTMYLFNLMRENNPSVKSPDFQKWADTMEKLIRIDKKNPEEIRSVIQWCQQDSFWKSNILSVDKLRKQYDQLFIKSKISTSKNYSKSTHLPDMDDYDLSKL